MKSSRRSVMSRCVNRRLSGVLGLLVLSTVLVPFRVKAQSGYSCTEVLGFSQSMQWFAASSFANLPASGDSWELGSRNFLPGWQGRFTFGAAIDRWVNSDYSGWEGTYVSPSHCAREEVDRVVFNVSGEARSADEWAAAIESVAQLVRAKYPEVRAVVMQPVVGAPPGECQAVRAARTHPTVVEGIARAAERDVVTAGPNPTVSACSQFRDALGHLTASGAEHVHGILRAHYARHRQ